MRGAVLAAGVLAAAGCLTPLSNKIEVGNEAFVVVAAEGAGGIVDLFAAPAEGGTFRQLTYTRATEELPRLGPSGTTLVFGRQSGNRSDPVVMNLLDGNERTAPLPEAAGTIVRFGWTSSGDTVVAATDRGLWWSPASASLDWTVVPVGRQAAADSATKELVGDPVFGSVGPCRTSGGLCVVTADEETPLNPDATEAFRWGGKAVGYLVRGRLEVRPLGGGRLRQPTWPDAPGGIHHPTHHPGTPRAN